MPSSESAGLRGSLFRKYVAYFVALVSTALIGSGLVGFYYTYEESKTARLNLQLEKADAAASRIEAFIREIEHQLGWMRLPQAGPVTPEHRRLDYLKLLRQVPSISDASLLDAGGREQLRVSRVAMNVVGSGDDYSASPKFTETRQAETYFSPVYFRRETEPYMTISVRSDTDEVTVAEVNLKFILEVISRIKVGRNGFAYLVDGKGHLIAHPDISLVLKKTDLSPLGHVRAALDGQKADGVERVMISRNVQGADALLAYAPVAPLGWVVFVEQPLAEAFAPLYSSLLRTGLLLLAGLGLAVTGSLFLARHMVMPIRAIQAGAARIAAGKLDQSISVHTGDELESLAGEFNDMAKQLREYYAGLERKVDERTRDLT
ncbi:MAG TPA: cache domain-containing protein, partial [Burkholderiales bacterium]|nr:cache domain-containing protein [Burkholderiales bacterium]